MADNSGPTWCVNSEEMGGGLAIVVAFFAAAFILAPAFMLGAIIGALIWNVKIFKFAFGAAFTVGYYFLLQAIWIANPIAAFITVLAIWLLLDYLSSKGIVSDMWIVRKTKSTFGWMFSA